jgi:hypothetical protein
MERTEVQTTDYVRCYRCRKPTFVNEIGPGKTATGSTTFYLFRLIPLHSWGHYGIVDLCPDCVNQEGWDELRRKRWILYVAAVVVMLWNGWQGMAAVGGLVATGFGICAAIRYRRRRRQALIIR